MLTGQGFGIEVLTVVALNATIGLVLLSVGRSIARAGDWLAFIGVSAIAIVALAEFLKFLEPGFEVLSVYLGWVGKGSETGSPHVGIYGDPFGLMMTGLGALLCLVTMGNRALIVENPKPERLYAAIVTALSGWTLAWLALTPWLSFVGIGLCALGGFLALGSRWVENDDEASFAVRFSWETVWALMLAILGACVLASLGSPIRFDGADEVFSQASARFGTILLVLGILVFFRPFPFFGWATKNSRTQFSVRILVTQVLLGGAVFSIFFRLQPHLGQVGILSIVSGLALGAACLSILVGLFQTAWERGAMYWLSSAFLVGIAMTADAGQVAGAGWVLGLVSGVTVIAVLGSLFVGTEPKSKGFQRPSADDLTPTKTFAVRLFIFLGCAGALGFAGFVGAASQVDWLHRLRDHVGPALTVAAILFLGGFLAWKVLFQIYARDLRPDVTWGQVLPSVLAIMAVAGVLWTGKLSGGAILDHPDEVGAPLLQQLLGQRESKIVPVEPAPQSQRPPVETGQVPAEMTSGIPETTTTPRVAVEDPATWTAPQVEEGLGAYGAFWVYWGALLLALASAYWTRRSLNGFFSRQSGSARFFREAFFVDRLGILFFRHALRLGYGLENAIGKNFWNDFVPRTFRAGLKYFASVLLRVDRTGTGMFNLAAQKTVNVPSKLLQLIQNGDLQWYLFFAIGVGTCILIHFLRN